MSWAERRNDNRHDAPSIFFYLFHVAAIRFGGGTSRVTALALDRIPKSDHSGENSHSCNYELIRN